VLNDEARLMLGGAGKAWIQYGLTIDYAAHICRGHAWRATYDRYAMPSKVAPFHLQFQTRSPVPKKPKISKKTSSKDMVVKKMELLKAAGLKTATKR